MRLVATLAFLLHYANAGDAPITAASITNDAMWVVNEIRKKYGAPEIKKVNDELEKEAQEAITKQDFIYSTYAGNFCSLHANPRPSDVGGLFLVTGQKEKPDKDEITLLVTYEADKAAQLLKRFPSEAVNAKSGIYEPSFVQNLVYLLFSQSDSMGCAATSNCTNSVSVVVCKFSPTWKPDGNLPLTGEVLAAITDGAAKLTQQPAVRGADINKIDQATPATIAAAQAPTEKQETTAAAQTPTEKQEVSDSSSAGAQAKGVEARTVSPREALDPGEEEEEDPGSEPGTGPTPGPADPPTAGPPAAGGSTTTPGGTTTETESPTSGVTAQHIPVAAVIILSFVGFISV